ncbi:tRNA (guanosine(37)-N1)-methyltransferase TrmD [Jatrophihabitans sp. YIM 134969]
MKVDVVTIFPDYLAPLRLSLPGRAIERGIVDLAVHDLRQWTDDVHRTVDHTPYGGGPGMVMLPEPWGRALDAVAPTDGEQQPTLVVPTPAGRRLDQALAAELATRPWLVFACGRYEGIDARVTADAGTRMEVVEISIGDVVVCGGEVAVLATVEAVVRLLPGVLGNADSAVHDSFSAGASGILETPPYTKPAVWRGRAVPEVLMSGHHGRIAAWRAEQGRALTRARRPDLLTDGDTDGPGSIPPG